MGEDKQIYDLDEYIRHGEASQKEKAENWQIAIGLQAVDGLKPSQYLLENAQRHIEGEITIEDVKKNLRTYYTTRTSRSTQEKEEEEADKVSANIAKLLASPTFSFTLEGLTAIHRNIFDGVFKFAGKIRDYDITKKEWVLNGDTVLYVHYKDICRTIEYDLSQEKGFSYTGLSMENVVKHIANFVSGLWQIHPFGEGNTRTTAVFTIKYLRSLGFEADNNLFAQYSWYFRNALVRANYHNVVKGIEYNLSFLTLFFRNLLLGEDNELKNRYCHIDWNNTGQVPHKYPTSTPQVPDKLRPDSPQVENLVRAVGEEQLSISEIIDKMTLKDRKNFIYNYLNPAIQQGFVRMLYPQSPHHPRQKYLLTIKGLSLYNTSCTKIP